MAVVAAMPMHAGVHGFRVEGLLLLGGQRGIEGLGGFGTLGESGAALGLAGLHALQALGRGELGEFRAVHALRAGRRLAGRCEGGPRAFLSGIQLELFLQRGKPLGAVLLHALHALGRVHALVLRLGCRAALGQSR
jgi:hypothetical protein